MDPLDATVAIPGHVVVRRFPAEVVVLNLETGKYHGLNPTAGKMLDVLVEEGRVSFALERLARDFGEPTERIAADLSALCDALARRGLIAIDGANEAGEPAG